MFRCLFLQLLIQEGLLATWVAGENPLQLLFQVLANYPVRVGEFDSDALLKHLRDQSRD